MAEEATTRIKRDAIAKSGRYCNSRVASLQLVKWQPRPGNVLLCVLMASFPASLAFQKPRRIVIGVDSSPYAEYAFRWASENLLRNGDEVFLVHAAQQAIVATATMQARVIFCHAQSLKYQTLQIFSYERLIRLLDTRMLLELWKNFRICVRTRD